MPVPTGWVSYLPLCTPADVRGRLLTPEAALSLSAAPDTPVGVSITGSVFTSGIPHGFADWTAVQFASTGTLPAPIVANTTYYVRDITSAFAFSVALTIGGAAIALTNAGTGQVSVSNWGLNDVIEAKIALATSWMYDELLTSVMNHIQGMSNGMWYGYFPQNDFGLVSTRTPRERAVVVLDNLQNPTQLKRSAVDATIWHMVEDGALRNQLFDAAFEQQRGPTLERTKAKAAQDSLLRDARLLIVDTANGANGLYNFDMTTDSIHVSIF